MILVAFKAGLKPAAIVRKPWLSRPTVQHVITGAQRTGVSPKARLGEKLGNTARHWDSLQLFLADGRIEMDSNSVEILIRPVALNWKNALSAGQDEGADA